MEKELISVIVPVHNGQAYLKNCIDSIEAQSYDNLEVLVVNDGSTDQTAAVCDDLKRRMEICGCLHWRMWECRRPVTLPFRRRRETA